MRKAYLTEELNTWVWTSVICVWIGQHRKCRCGLSETSGASVHQAQYLYFNFNTVAMLCTILDVYFL